MSLLRFPRVRRLTGRLAAAGLLLAVLAQPAAAPLRAAPQVTCTTVVTAGGDSGLGTLRDAVACAAPGGTVTFGAGLTGLTISLTTGQINVSSSLTIDGSGAPGVKVDAGSLSRIFNISAANPVTLTALILQHGASSGGGGAVLVTTGTLLTLNQVNVLSSTATSLNGGGVFATGLVTLNGGRFEGNTCQQATCWGGGLALSGTLRLTGTQFLANTSGLAGGGAAGTAPAAVSGARFQANACTAAGCGGGGLLVNNTLALTDTDFISNTSTIAGGGAASTAAVTVSGGRFERNACTGATCTGGGVLTFGSLTLTGTTFLTNTSLGGGGGALALGTTTVTNSTFQGNRCSEEFCTGGGLSANSNPTVTNSTFSGNEAASGGGLAGGQLSVVNVTFAANIGRLVGGGAYVSFATNRLVNVTLADNQAPDGGAIYAVAGATVGVTNTVVSYNGSAGCAGQIDLGSHNIEWPGTTCATVGPTAGFTSADALLKPLALNAPGTTMTHGLLNASPARDAGDAATCAGPLVNNRDQRGVVRPIDGDHVLGAVCDLGAFEADPPLDWRLYLPLILR